MASKGVQLTDEEVFFYEDQVCGQAENVYRFCFALEMKPDSARKLMQLAYKDAAKNIGTLVDCSATELRSRLLSYAYKNFSDAGNKSDASPLNKFLGSLSVADRAALVGQDVIGLTIEEMAGVLELETSDLHESLGRSRGALVKAFA